MRRDRLRETSEVERQSIDDGALEAERTAISIEDAHKKGEKDQHDSWSEQDANIIRQREVSKVVFEPSQCSSVLKAVL